MTEPIPQIKVVVVGDESVGKTALVNKWVNGTFSTQVAPTIGGTNLIKRLKVGDEMYCFQIWDTAGAERYRSLTPLYTRDAKAAIIVFDLTKKSTYDNLIQWINFLHENGNIPFVIAGNKEDLYDLNKVLYDEAQAFAHSHKSLYFTCSAKDGSNVELVFSQLTCIAVRNYMDKYDGDSQQIIAEPRKEKKSCC